MNLEDLNDKDFRTLVDQELRKDHPQTSVEERERLSEAARLLREPETIGRWISVLEVMKSSSETQLGAKLSEIKKLHGTISQEDYETKLRPYLSWKAGNVRFLHSVQQRLIEAREVRMRLFGASLPIRIVEERNLASQSLLHLIEAIETHRQTVLGEYDPTDADETLWESLPEIS